LSRPAELVALRGHPERELLRTCVDADLLLLAWSAGATECIKRR